MRLFHKGKDASNLAKEAELQLIKCSVLAAKLIRRTSTVLIFSKRELLLGALDRFQFSPPCTSFGYRFAIRSCIRFL